MQNFLLFNVVPALEDMMELRHIIDTHTLHFHGVKTTYTVEFFAYGLRDLVQPICQLLIAYEDRVNKDPAKNTLIPTAPTIHPILAKWQHRYALP